LGGKNLASFVASKKQLPSFAAKRHLITVADVESLLEYTFLHRLLLMASADDPEFNRATNVVIKEAMLDSLDLCGISLDG